MALTTISGEIQAQPLNDNFSYLNERKNDILFNVKDYDAEGNGVTGDTNSIIAAAVAAYAVDGILYFPHSSGTYLITGNITYFNDVRKAGPGVIELNSIQFTMDPTTNDINTLYVDANSGSDSNIGLSATFPFATLQKSFDILRDRNEVLEGTWKIQLAAGTYNEQAQLSSGLRSKNRIQILGVDVATPTVIFDGGSGTRIYGMHFSDYAFIKIQDIKFQNFTGSSHSGLIAQHFCNIWTINVHADNCGFGGINANELCRFFVQGGIINNCGIGIRIYSSSVATIGYNSTGLSDSTIITNCTQSGILLQNNSVGNLNYVTLDTDVIGIRIVNQCRSHIIGSDIKNNITAGVYAQINSTWNDDATTTNSFSGNAANWKHVSFSAELNRDYTKRGKLVSLVDTTQISHTGTLAETLLKTGSTVSANNFIDQGKKIKIIASGTFAGAGTKKVSIKFGANLMTEFTSASGSSKHWQMEAEVFAITSTSQKVFGKLIEGNTAFNALYVPRAINMTSDVSITIYGTLSDVASTLNIETFEITEVL